MRRFFGKVGYGIATETAPSVWEDVITEVEYYGDVVRNTVQIDQSSEVNAQLKVGVSISILADEFANEHFHAIRYVEWAGTRWTVPSVDVQSPRLLLRLGEVYNGPTP